MSLHFQFIVTEEQVNFLLLQQFSKYSISFLFLILELFISLMLNIETKQIIL